MTAPDLTPAALADLLDAAADLLNSEEVRYTQRFDACPNGCRFEYPTAVVTADGQRREVPDWNAPLVRVDGPDDCQTCNEGIVEDENGPSVQPLVDAVAEAARRLRQS